MEIRKGKNGERWVEYSPGEAEEIKKSIEARFRTPLSESLAAHLQDDETESPLDKQKQTLSSIVDDIRREPAEPLRDRESDKRVVTVHVDAGLVEPMFRAVGELIAAAVEAGKAMHFAMFGEELTDEEIAQLAGLDEEE